MRNCSNCLFWVHRPDLIVRAGPIGECRHESPVTASNATGRNVTTWPTTKAHDWCGRHQPAGRATERPSQPQPSSTGRPG